MSLRQKAAKGIFWSMIQKWGRAMITTVSFVVLSRLLDPVAFGLVALSTVFTEIIEIFLDQGSSAAIVQRKELEPEHIDTAFWISIFGGLLLMTITIAGSGLISKFFHEPRLASILIWLSPNFILNALSTTQLALLQRQLAFKTMAARSLISTAIGGIVGIVMAFAGYGVWSLVVGTLANNAAAAIVLWGASDWRPRFRFSKKHYKDIVSFGVSIVGNNVLNHALRRSDDFLIGYFLGPVLLGYYTIGHRLLIIIIRLVTEVSNRVAFPIFSRLQGNVERMRRAFYNVTQYTSLLSFPIFLGLATLSPEVVPTVFGAKWAPSIPVMQVLSFIGILQSVLFFNGSVMRASGKPNWEFAIMLISSSISMLGFLVAVRWGIVAVAASYVITGYLLSPVSYIALRRLIQIDILTYLKQFSAPFLASAIMVGTIMVLKFVLKPLDLNAYLELSVYIVAGALAYLLVILLTARELSQKVLDLALLAIPKLKIRKFS
jgi:PST family polysaccharide transporter